MGQMLFHSLSVRPHWPWRQDICGHLPQSLGCEYRPQMCCGHFPQRWCFGHHQQRCQGGHLPPRVSLKCEVQGGLSHQKMYGTVPQRSSGKLILFSSPWIWAMRAAFITLSSLIVLWSCLFSSLSWKLRSSRSACSTAATFAHVLHWSDVLLCCSSAFFLASLGLNRFSAWSFSVAFSTKYFGHSWSEALWGPEQLKQCGEFCLLQSL